MIANRRVRTMSSTRINTLTRGRQRVRLVEQLEHRLLLASQTFSSATSIAINDSFSAPTEATPYPATINASGVSGSMTGMTLQLKNFSHSAPGDIDILLVSPSGASIILM